MTLIRLLLNLSESISHQIKEEEEKDWRTEKNGWRGRGHGEWNNRVGCPRSTTQVVLGWSSKWVHTHANKSYMVTTAAFLSKTSWQWHTKHFHKCTLKEAHTGPQALITKPLTISQWKGSSLDVNTLHVHDENTWCIFISLEENNRYVEMRKLQIQQSAYLRLERPADVHIFRGYLCLSIDCTHGEFFFHNFGVVN